MCVKPFLLCVCVCVNTIMSFRSRSRTVQPVVHRRSLSGSRLPNSLQSSYTSNRPMSSAYPSSSSTSSAYSTSNYISPYSSISSRDSIYGSLQPTRNSYYNSSNVSSRRDSYSGSSGSGASTIYKNPYTSDRYISPYTSYDNGVTTAGLSLKSSSAYGGTNGYTNKSSYTPLLTNKSSLRHSSKHLSASNTSLNSYTTTASSSPSIVAGTNTNLGRSQSFRDQTSDRKSRTNLRRNASLKSERSLSVSSEKSEGYEVWWYDMHLMLQFIYLTIRFKNFTFSNKCLMISLSECFHEAETSGG